MSLDWPLLVNEPPIIVRTTSSTQPILLSAVVCPFDCMSVAVRSETLDIIIWLALSSRSSSSKLKFLANNIIIGRLLASDTPPIQHMVVSSVPAAAI